MTGKSVGNIYKIYIGYIQTEWDSAAHAILKIFFQNFFEVFVHALYPPQYSLLFQLLTSLYSEIRHLQTFFALQMTNLYIF